MGNGRATVLRFVQEGATVMAVDRDLASAEETVAMAREHDTGRHGTCVAFEADATKEATLAAMVASAREQFGRIDVLHYNVGVSIAGGDAPPTEITEEAFDRVVAINLRGCVMAVKHALPVMRAQRPASSSPSRRSRSTRTILTSPTRRPRPPWWRSPSRWRSRTPSTASAPTASCRG
jgi:NAD(P)-dependent dehydrogenase (short-subunit alcohol dehydrogenase family)